MRTWDPAKSFVETHQRFLVTTHMYPEGDAIGSVIACACFLEALGKSAEIVIANPVPRNCQFLDPEGRIRVYDPATGEQVLADKDALIILDTSEWHRLGSLCELLRSAGLASLCIDHHASAVPLADVNVIDEHAAAASELLYDLMKESGHQPSPPAATALYTAVATDTGWFRFTNTTPAVHEMCADLMRRGANPTEIYEQAYERKSWGRIRLEQHVLSTFHTEAEGAIIWFAVTRETMQETGATRDDTERLFDLVRGIEGVELALYFSETEDDKIKVGLRSRERVDVMQLAKRFGGGGHRRAAGILLDEREIDLVIEKVLAAARNAI